MLMAERPLSNIKLTYGRHKMTQQNEFPFEAVYEHFARPVVKIGLDEDTFSPSMFSVCMMGDKIIQVSPLPREKIGKFFQNSSTKELLSIFLAQAIASIGDNPYCLVLMSESWVKEYSKEDIGKARKHGSLEFDKDATSAIMIAIYRPEGTRIGMLPINEDRSVTYKALPKNQDAHGRLVANSKEKAPEKSTV